jgi:glycosyltransferase involved in cell wall biosynthesis
MKVLVITHSTSNTGAPKICLSVIRYFRSRFNSLKLDVLSMDSNLSLNDDFVKMSDRFISVSDYSKKKDYTIKSRILYKLSSRKFESDYDKLIDSLIATKYDIIYANTIVTFSLAISIKFSNENTKIIGNILEMSTVINQLCSNFTNLINQIDSCILINQFHKEHIEKAYNISIYNSFNIIPPIETPKLIKMTNHSPIVRVVMSGSVHWRKGDDVFIQVARKILALNLNVEFYWFGDIDLYHKEIINNDLIKLGIKENVYFLGEISDTFAKLVEMDIFLLTSREEPFGLAPAEAAKLGIPIIYFKNVTGIGSLLEDHNIDLGVPYLDIDAMTEKLIYLIKNKVIRDDFGIRVKEVLDKYNEVQFWLEMDKMLSYNVI